MPPHNPAEEMRKLGARCDLHYQLVLDKPAEAINCEAVTLCTNQMYDAVPMYCMHTASYTLLCDDMWCT